MKKPQQHQSVINRGTYAPNLCTCTTDRFILILYNFLESEFHRGIYQLHSVDCLYLFFQAFQFCYPQINIKTNRRANSFHARIEFKKRNEKIIICNNKIKRWSKKRKKKRKHFKQQNERLIVYLFITKWHSALSSFTRWRIDLR